jgi:hypothetical protein
MSESPLSMYAGPIAVIAGGLFAVAHVGMFFVADRSDLVAMMTEPVFLVFNAAYAITFPLLLIALVALYWRQAGEAGLSARLPSVLRPPALSPWLVTCGSRVSPCRGSLRLLQLCSARID